MNSLLASPKKTSVSSLDRDFLILCALILLILLVFSGTMGWQTFKNQKNMQAKELYATLKTIEGSLDTSFTTISDFMQYIGDEVLNTYNGKVESAVHLFKHNFAIDTRLDNFFAWTQLSWVNTENRITISPEGILSRQQQLPRNYPLEQAKQKSWILQIGNISTRDNYTYFPVAMGIKTDAGRYVGAITSDIISEKLQRDIRKVLGHTYASYDFVIWDNQGHIIASSQTEQSPYFHYENTQKLLLTAHQNFPYLMADNDTIIDQYKLSDCPLYIIVTPSISFLHASKFWPAFLPRLSLATGLTFIFLLLIYSFRRRTILPAIRELQINLAEETAARKEKDRLLSQILEGVSGFVYRHLVQGDDIITEYVSEGCLQLTGYPAHRYFGENRIRHSDVIHPDHQCLVINHIKRAITQKEPFELSYPIITSKGETKWVLNQGHPINALKDSLSFTVEGFLTDITEMKYAQQQMEMAFEALKMSNSELEEFAYACSHDLKEPLRTIYTCVQFYKREQDPKYLKYVEENLLRMKHLIETILIYSQLGINAPKKEEINDLNHIIDYVKQLMYGAITDTQAAIHIEPLGKVIGDREQLCRVFQNLLSNALKFFDDESPVIRIGGRQEENMWILFVKDKGIGIAPEYHTRIFNLFERLHSKDQYQGSGIGLALCKKIIERHNGKIWVESEVGQGTTFFLSLPAAT